MPIVELHPSPPIPDQNPPFFPTAVNAGLGCTFSDIVISAYLKVEMQRKKTKIRKYRYQGNTEPKSQWRQNISKRNDAIFWTWCCLDIDISLEMYKTILDLEQA
jgi:hypothetical protein